MRSLEALHSADEACLRFEDDWRAGRRPDVARYLSGVTAEEREELLAELLLLEWDYRCRAGDSFFLEEYGRRYAAMRAAVERAWARWKEHERQPRDTPPAGETTPVDTPPAPLARPGAFAPPGYERVSLISRGGMGEVYRAFDPRLGRWVALKQVRLEQATPEALARFRREAEVLARLAHPHIVKVHSYAEHEGQPLLEMELVAGGALEERLKAPIAPAEAARLVAVLAWAVHAAHEKGVVHRDLKPANVLMDETVPGNAGNVLGGYPKVSDFGLAAMRDAVSGQTLTGAVLGTPAYMAPEQAAGRSREVGPPSDVWALGVILYRCLAGALPFEGDSVLDTLERVKAMQMRPLREAAPGAPTDLEAVVLACLRREPSERPTAKGLAERLEALAGSLSPTRGGGAGEGRGRSEPPREDRTLLTRQPLPPPGARGGRHRRRVVAVGAGMAAMTAGVVALALWAPWLQRKTPVGGGTGPVTSAGAGGPLAVTLRVRHYDRIGKADVRSGDIGYDTQGAKFDDRVIVAVSATRPAYLYLLACNTDGKAELLWPCDEGHPRVPGDPKRAPSRQAGVTYPPPNPETGKPRGIRLNDHKEGGMQAFVVIASEKALPAYAEWAKGRGAVPWQRLPPVAGVWRSDGQTLDPVRKGDVRVRGGVVDLEGEPPLLGLTRWAKGPGVELVEAIAFPVYRREGE